jgi:hypothetical protein
VVQDKLHEPIDVSIDEKPRALRNRRDMHDDAALCSELQGAHGPIEATFFPSYFIMSLRPVIIQAQINLIQPCRSEPFHVGLINDIPIRLQGQHKSIGFPSFDDFEEITTQRGLAAEQIDDQAARKLEFLKE